VEALKQFAGLSFPNATAIAAFALLIVVALASPHLIAFLAAALLASVGCLILILPDLTTFILAVGAMLGSLLILVAGMHSRRRRAALEQKLERLKRDIAKLNCAESGRLLRVINSASTQSLGIIQAEPQPNEPQPKKSKARSRPSPETSGFPPSATRENGSDPSSGALLPAIGSAPTQPSQPEEPKIEKRKARPRRSAAKPNAPKEDDSRHGTSRPPGGSTENASPPSALTEGAALAYKGNDRAGSEGV